VDLTGGLDPTDDRPNLDPARDLDIGENHAFWLFDDAGEYALLNCHVQAGGMVAPGQSLTDWASRRVVFAIAAPDDRLFVDFAIGPGSTPDELVVGGWTFRCVEPFRQWEAHYRGTPLVTTATETRSRMVDLDGERAPVEIDMTLEMALPPWIQGAFAEDRPGRDDGLRFIGVPRYEQLYRAEGEIRHDGATHALHTTGLRTHRYGRRGMGGMNGHSWLSAVFPSGRGFGSMRFPGPDGEDLFREAWVTGDSELVGARLVDSPWLRSLDCVGETWKVVLDTPGGPTEIDGETIACSYTMGLGVNPSPDAFVLVHGMARFRWDGEEASGLIERSAPMRELVP
jgi:hypothetical protein